MEGENELTVQEAELYDRQIRLWGLESQKRIRSGSVLLSGLNGLGAEIAKNIILAGVKTITLLDHRLVTETDSYSQFFVPQTSIGINRAVASEERAKKLNPMVAVIIDQDNINDKNDAFFLNFNVVIVIEETIATLIKVNKICRNGKIKFFCGDVWGMFGYSFIDLDEHKYSIDIVKRKLTKTEETVTTTVSRKMKFAPLENVLNFDYKSVEYAKRIKHSGPAVFVLQVLQKFREENKRDPDYKLRDEDTTKLLEMVNGITPTAGMISSDYFDHVYSQLAPVAAIVGGEISQETIKAISQKDAPHRNLFLFDPIRNSGFVEPID